MNVKIKQEEREEGCHFITSSPGFQFRLCDGHKGCWWSNATFRLHWMGFLDVYFTVFSWSHIRCCFSTLGPKVSYRSWFCWEGSGERRKILLDRGRGLSSFLPGHQPMLEAFHTLADLWLWFWQWLGPLAYTLCLYLPLCSESIWGMWTSPCVQPWLPCLLQPFRLLANKHPITHIANENTLQWEMIKVKVSIWP